MVQLPDAEQEKVPKVAWRVMRQQNLELSTTTNSGMWHNSQCFWLSSIRLKTASLMHWSKVEIRIPKEQVCLILWWSRSTPFGQKILQICMPLRADSIIYWGCLLPQVPAGQFESFEYHSHALKSFMVSSDEFFMNRKTFSASHCEFKHELVVSRHSKALNAYYCQLNMRVLVHWSENFNVERQMQITCICCCSRIQFVNVSKFWVVSWTSLLACWVAILAHLATPQDFFNAQVYRGRWDLIDRSCWPQLIKKWWVTPLKL